MISKVLLYADDTSLCYSSSNLADIELILNNDHRKLKKWADKWLIIFNPLKTEFMLISNIFHDYDLRLMYDNAPLTIIGSHKNIGIHLASNNKWTKHLDSINDSASEQVSYLRKLKYQLTKSTRDKLYCTYLRPLLEYCCEVWDGCNITDTNCLEQVQLNAARIATG